MKVAGRFDTVDQCSHTFSEQYYSPFQFNNYVLYAIIYYNLLFLAYHQQAYYWPVDDVLTFIVKFNFKNLSLLFLCCKL